MIRLDDALYSQGWGTRRVCAGLIQQGLVEVLGADGLFEPCAEPRRELDETGLVLRVQDVDWPFHRKAYLMLHKPRGTECSQRPSAYPSVYSLLPSPLRNRPTKGSIKGVQAIGRLDHDTTGLLLLSDDGQFIHKMASPKSHVPKVYEVTTKHPVGRAQIQRLLEGVVLDDDPAPVRASACEVRGERQLDLALTQGKYHQVKRMIAAVGNRVEGLHRRRIGALELPPDLLPCQWRWLAPAELAMVGGAPDRVDA